MEDNKPLIRYGKFYLVKKDVDFAKRKVSVIVDIFDTNEEAEEALEICREEGPDAEFVIDHIS